MSNVGVVGGGSGGGGAWGSITGTLSDQTDLQSALDARVVLAGVSGGQTVHGGTAASNNLVLRSTSNATKGLVAIADEGGHVTIGGGASASELRFLEPSGSGTHYSSFKAQAQAASLDYTLPAAHGTDQYLKNNGSGTLSWAAVSVTPGGSDTEFQYNNGGALGGTTHLTYNDSTGALAYTPTGSPSTVHQFNVGSMTTFTTARLITGTLPTGATSNLDYISVTIQNSTTSAKFLRRTAASGGSMSDGQYLVHIYTDLDTTHSGKTLGAIYDAGANGVIGDFERVSGGSSGGGIGQMGCAYNSNYCIGGTFAGILPAGSSPQSYGVRAYATGENSAQQVGGFFRIYTVQSSANETANPGVSAAIVVTNGDTTNDIVNVRDNTTEVFVIENGGTIDISGIAAGTPNFRVTATSDTPTVTWGAAAGNEASTAPAGYMELTVGGNARYIPFWA